MRYIIWYLRSVFCSHSWRHEELRFKIRNEYNEIVVDGPKVSATCDKCGWHRTYWKFGGRSGR
jgi:RNase P subunit RPR2